MNSVNLRQVPSVEKLVQAVAGAVGLPRRVVAGVARAEAARIREQVVAGGEGVTFAEGVSRVRDELQRLERTALRPVINGTGVVLHTNLGRAPLGPVVAARVVLGKLNYNMILNIKEPPIGGSFNAYLLS